MIAAAALRLLWEYSHIHLGTSVALLMLLVVGAYWAYVLSESGYSFNNSYDLTQSYNSDVYRRPSSTNEGSSPVDNFLKEKDNMNEIGYKQAKAEEELVEAQEIIDNYKNKQPEEVEVNNSEIETIEIEIKELQEKKDELLSRLEAIQKDYRSGLSADSEEQAIQLENAEVLEEISRVTNEELQKVSQALDRIELQLKQ